MRDGVVGHRAPTASRMADNDRSLRPRKGERGSIIDRGCYVARRFEAGKGVIVARTVGKALSPVPTGCAIATPQDKKATKARVKNPPRGSGGAVSGHGVPVVGNVPCAMTTTRDGASP